MEPLNLFIAFAVATGVSIFGSTAGGSGLVILPALIFLGLEPAVAIASSVVGYLGMCNTGMYVFHKAEKVDFRLGIPLAVLAAIGAAIGALTLQQLSSELLERLIGIFLLITVAFLFVQGDWGLQNTQPPRWLRIVGYVLMIPIGLHAVLIAAGTTIFLIYIFVFCFGQTLLECAGTRKIVFFGTNLTGVLFLGYADLIQWHYAIVLFLGTSLGTWFGVHHALHKGDAWVKKLLIIVIIISGLKLLM